MAFDQIESAAEFENAKKNNASCVVIFSAAWSQLSEQTKSIFQRNASQYPSTYIGWLEIDLNSDLVAIYKVTAIPHVIGFKNGKEINKFIGPMILDSQAKSFIEETQ
ncbi:hypothetical protein RAB80_007416 [Fusarium oxysporum f. sp. vasinfectum]|uniref:Thioredoxin domain-containing protein n=1 Tax=Fusarium oxysporum f. sp. vasinfectum 25433 TaxID=1089449 RepID=X0KM33_FUSOX|nr:hypothetical protein FOTG_16992 [Fusarium oxysporum f. sp. vasinfectum 25433]KAK2678676.1 hypothetical protein RAB80_007416 [Fusarium oxysporum f. sp. vasinfectum]KAK2923537.1 hypothetical protein FoTM2_015694 [Fusarium oxysporum f. sp. vasinfectum]KAK2938787.1 hypothetical protein FoTM2_002005 [Fusarium oxysporum f. sp. vasinfectum]